MKFEIFSNKILERSNQTIEEVLAGVVPQKYMQKYIWIIRNVNLINSSKIKLVQKLRVLGRLFATFLTMLWRLKVKNFWKS